MMGAGEGKYDLIAFDMDGTLLTGDKKISRKTLDAMLRAEKENKIIAIATGRPLAEMQPYEQMLGGVRFQILESGAIIFDRSTGKIIERHTIDKGYIPEIVEASKKEDVMIQAMSMGKSIVSQGVIPKMSHWSMEIYRPLYEMAATCVPDVRTYVLESDEGVEKINLYHVSREASVRTAERLGDIPIEKVYAEETSLELSPKGIDKGTGLEDLCRVIGIPIERTIAVGDADNDLPMIRKAGLGVAMGNANDHIRKAAGAQTADSDHDGCALAIERFLLSKG